LALAIAPQVCLVDNKILHQEFKLVV
jgi:hypothetical protein